MGTVGNIKIEPMVVTWGENTAQVQTVTTRADASSDLNNDYFFLSASDGSLYYVWFNVASGGSDPSIAGYTAIPVAIAADADANTVAAAVQSAVDGNSDFSASVSTNVVTITDAANGFAQFAREGVGTNFTFAVTTVGDSAADIGFVDGAISFSMSEDLVDVTAHETGTNVLSQIRSGKQVEITMNFKETTVAQLRKLFIHGGNAFTPSGASGTEVFGWGMGRDFTQTITQSRKLLLHPKVLGAGDLSRDLTFHKAYPILESLEYSGEDVLMVPVTFKIYPDDTKQDNIEYFVFADSTQTLT